MSISAIDTLPYSELKAPHADPELSERTMSSAIPVESPYVYKIEENDATAWQISKKDSEHALSNVFKDINSFSFDTHFKSDKTVVTQICYETGFSLRAKKNGIFENIKTFKLNGGLLGFEAPAGDVSYVLSYETPYLSEWNGMPQRMQSQKSL